MKAQVERMAILMTDSSVHLLHVGIVTNAFWWLYQAHDGDDVGFWDR